MSSETAPVRLTFELSPQVAGLLEVLTGGPFGPADLHAVVMELVDHAQQGVYRPGSWERPWLVQAFGDEWLDKLEPGDPYGRDAGEPSPYFQRPRRGS